MSNDRLLTIYLNDHLAAEVALVELSKRCRSSNPEGPLGNFLEELVTELEADRATLVDVIRSLGMHTNPVKHAVGWMAEKVGRLKPNGRLAGYSPLSRLLELEGLGTGVGYKLGVWRCLRLVASSDPHLADFDFDSLVERATGQREALERHRQDAAALAFGVEGPVVDEDLND